MCRIWKKNLKSSIITGDKTWAYGCDAEIELQLDSTFISAVGDTWFVTPKNLKTSASAQPGEGNATHVFDYKSIVDHEYAPRQTIMK